MLCGVSVVDGAEWERLKRYNVNELYRIASEEANQEGKEESTTEAKDESKDDKPSTETKEGESKGESVTAE